MRVKGSSISSIHTVATYMLWEPKPAHIYSTCSDIPASILRICVSSSVWNLTLHRPDRGVDQHLVKSCSCLPVRGKAWRAESQPSCFTSPTGTASQRAAGNRCYLLTTAGKSTKNEKFPGWKWRTHSSDLKASAKTKAKYVPKRSPVSELGMFVWTFKNLLHACRHCRKALGKFGICCMTAGCASVVLLYHDTSGFSVLLL